MDGCEERINIAVHAVKPNTVRVNVSGIMKISYCISVSFLSALRNTCISGRPHHRYLLLDGNIL